MSGRESPARHGGIRRELHAAPHPGLGTEYLMVLSFMEERESCSEEKKANVQLRGYLMVEKGLTISLGKTISPSQPSFV